MESSNQKDENNCFERRMDNRQGLVPFSQNVNSVCGDIMDASFDPFFVIDEFGIILMVNQKAVEALGWTREEFLGENISMVVGGVHAKSHDSYLSRYNRTGECRIIGRRRKGLSARRKDGSEFPVELGIRELLKKPGSVHHSGVATSSSRYFCGFLRDLTAEMKHEKELAYKQRISDGILNASFDAMVAIDRKGQIIRANEAAVRQHGYSMEELIGSNVSMLCGGDHGKNHDKYMKRYLKTGDKRVIGVKRELFARRKSGEEFPIELGIQEITTLEGESIFCGFIRDLTEHKRCIELEVENSKAETLLLNMLPENIAERLKRNPSHIADHHSKVSILFGDIVGFTELSSRLSPDALVRLLDELFSKFDALVDQYDMNKVKTIGDCYMVTSHPNMINQDTECKLICDFSLQMMEVIKQFNKCHPEHNLSLRIGINTGSVVAGVVGTKRFLYDLWGDAVNIASRMGKLDSMTFSLSLTFVVEYQFGFFSSLQTDSIFFPIL